MESQTLTDRRVVAAQLGRPAQGRWTVVGRCPYGYPQVIRVFPIVSDRPFPTLYWLTCPFLRTGISRLEADGWIKRLEERMRNSSELSEMMCAAHEQYARERNALQASMQREMPVAGLRDRGIGGLADRRYLKCLHLHVAHALVGENAIGTIVLDLLPEQACAPKEVICSAYV